LGQQFDDIRPAIDRDGATVIDGLFAEALTQGAFGGRPREE
jgi:hypothetical protein